jgi:hypothetical protein
LSQAFAARATPYQDNGWRIRVKVGAQRCAYDLAVPLPQESVASARNFRPAVAFSFYWHEKILA